MATTETPNRIFKLCVASELEAFKEGGKVLSSLDKADGFVHLSDRTSGPTVASLFFKEAKDLRLIELAADKLPGNVTWVTAKMGDAVPENFSGLKGGELGIHYLVPDGCVHVYGPDGVPMSAMVREEHVPLGDDGKHVFPAWL